MHDDSRCVRQPSDPGPNVHAEGEIRGTLGRASKDHSIAFNSNPPEAANSFTFVYRSRFEYGLLNQAEQLCPGLELK